MECKVIFFIQISSPSFCINRNIVECKDTSPFSVSATLARINRNIVECKDTHASLSMSTSPVLIETSWNVKNQIMTPTTFWGTSINRNIVECKDFYAGCSIIYNSVLIETSWNVKYSVQHWCSVYKPY